MPPAPYPIEDFMSPAACHPPAPGAASPATIGAPQSRRGEGDDSDARTSRGSIGQHLAALGTTPHLPPPRLNLRAAYAALVRRTVTLVTIAWRGRPRRMPLDPTVGALRHTGLFVRSPARGRREDEADGGESRLMPAAVGDTDGSRGQ